MRGLCRCRNGARNPRARLSLKKGGTQPPDAASSFVFSTNGTRQPASCASIAVYRRQIDSAFCAYLLRVKPMQVAQAARLLHLTELMTLCASAGVGSEGWVVGSGCRSVNERS